MGQGAYDEKSAWLVELHSAPDLLAQAEPEGTASFCEKLRVAHGKAMLWQSYASNMAAKGNSEAWAEEMSRYTSVWTLLIIHDQEHSISPDASARGRRPRERIGAQDSRKEPHNAGSLRTEGKSQSHLP